MLAGAGATVLFHMRNSIPMVHLPQCAQKWSASVRSGGPAGVMLHSCRNGEPMPCSKDISHVLPVLRV